MKKLLLSMLMCAMALGAVSQSSLRGDVNGDGSVNISDVNAVISAIIDGAGNTTAADVNGDGTVNITDVNVIISIILDGSGHSMDEGDWVDLGLPSGTIWATRNVGASSPEDYGDYFSWGETEPKVNYDWSTYKWCNGSKSTQTKYCTKSGYGYNGFVDNKTELDQSDDAACAHYPGGRMPSQEQIDELCNSCTWQWTQRNGVNGQLVTGPNGNTMFLPITGYRDGSSLNEADSRSCYWSRSLNTYNPHCAYYLYYYSGDLGGWPNGHRSYGFTVRAVRISQN